jgi:hypothetical protein
VARAESGLGAGLLLAVSVGTPAWGDLLVARAFATMTRLYPNGRTFSMNRRRWALAGIAMMASLSLATAGCANEDGSSDNNSTDTGTTTSTAPADAKQALVDSVKALAEGNFKFTLADDESTGSGSVHAPSKSAQLTAKPKSGEGEGEINFVIVDQDRWLKLNLGSQLNAALKLPKKWMHIDPTKVEDSELLKEMSIEFGSAEKVDPVGSAIILNSLVSAERAGDGAYSGTVDLTKATDAGLVDEDDIDKLADKAKTIPFTATVDGQGRLTKLTLEIPAAGDAAAHQLEATYSEYGNATAARKPPASQTQEPPASVYEVLNS